MITAIQTAIANPALNSIAQSTTSALMIETGLKAVGRPSFILMDKDISPQTKKYAAVKELIYQGTCLIAYMALIVPVFKRGAFKLAQKGKLLKNDTHLFKDFKNCDEFLKHHKKLSAEDKTAELEKYAPVKGLIEFGNIIGSVLGLAMIAPQVSHVTIHPILRALGMEKKEH
ncbi:MAG: hypothetical protein LBJ74_02270 [Heliobacteriaceae bacterium]|jgi:hypothetical protein|nr:hypothetical protein [Heliobacteriaceae bacterium]